MLAGVAAFGFVSWSQALETWPSIAARGARERDHRDDRDQREHAEQHASGDPLGLRRGRPLGREEARDQAEREQQHEHQQQQRAELVAGVGAHRERQLVRRQAGHRERPADHRAAPAVAPSSTIAPRSRSGTTANQNASPTTSASSAPRE